MRPGAASITLANMPFLTPRPLLFSKSTIRSPVDDIDLKAVINVPDTPVWVAAGSGGRLLRSQDNGRSWTVASSGHAGSFLTLTHDATSAQILVGGETGLVGHSRDLGKTWSVTRTHMPEPATPVSGFHRFGGLLVATSARGRLLTSTDDAGTWSLLQADSNAFFTDAAYDPVHSHIVVTGHN